MYLSVGLKKQYLENVLQDSIVNQYNSLEKFLTDNWIHEEKRSYLLEISGCLDKFRSSILFIDKLVEYQHAELKNPINLIPISGSLCSYSLFEACSYFESLILHARSSLDRLTDFVTKHYFSRTHRFRKLENTLRNYKNNTDAKKLLNYLNTSKWLNNLFLGENIDNTSSIRDFIAHYGSIMEKIDNCFSIYHKTEDEILLYDMEFQIPLFKTTWLISQYLPYFILNSLSLFTTGHILNIDQYTPKWQNYSIVVSEYKTVKGISIPIIKKMTPSGFEKIMCNVSEKVLDNLLQIRMIDNNTLTQFLDQGWHIIYKREDVIIIGRNKYELRRDE